MLNLHFIPVGGFVGSICKQISLTLCRTADAVPGSRASSDHNRGRLAFSAEIPYCGLTSSRRERLTSPQIRALYAWLSPDLNESYNSTIRCTRKLLLFTIAFELCPTFLIQFTLCWRTLNETHNTDKPALSGCFKANYTADKTAG